MKNPPRHTRKLQRRNVLKMLKVLNDADVQQVNLDKVPALADTASCSGESQLKLAETRI